MRINKFIANFKKNFFRISLYTLFTFLLFLFPTTDKYSDKVEFGQGLNFKEFKLPPPPPVPVNISGVSAPILSARGIYIIDIPSNIAIYEKDSQEKFSPASTVKIATALVGLDYYKLDDVLKVRSVIKEGRVMGLTPGEQITFESLLYGALVHSANDAAFTIAENYPGGVNEFVKRMNEKAATYNLTNTHFTNPIGLDDPNMYITASDLAKLSKIALSNKTFAKIVSTKGITVSDVNFTIFHELKNVNELLGKVAGVGGVKTGFTQNAGEILVSEVKKNSKNLLFVVLNSRDRFGDTEKLIEWTFANFDWKDINTLYSSHSGETAGK